MSSSMKLPLSWRVSGLSGLRLSICKAFLLYLVNLSISDGMGGQMSLSYEKTLGVGQEILVVTPLPHQAKRKCAECKSKYTNPASRQDLLQKLTAPRVWVKPGFDGGFWIPCWITRIFWECNENLLENMLKKNNAKNHIDSLWSLEFDWRWGGARNL